MKPFVFFTILAFSFGCGGGEDEAPINGHAALVKVHPREGSNVFINGHILLEFSHPPSNVNVSPGYIINPDKDNSWKSSFRALPRPGNIGGEIVVVAGLFPAGGFKLTVVWNGGAQTFTYLGMHSPPF